MLLEIRRHNDEASAALSGVVAEKQQLQRSYDQVMRKLHLNESEMAKMRCSLNLQVRNFGMQNASLRQELASMQEELATWAKQDKKQSQDDLERINLLVEKDKEVIDEQDSELKELRSRWGEGAYNAVANALLELNEYNPSGRYAVSELWNFKEGRKASLKEVVQCLTQQLKTLNSVKRRRGLST